MSESSNAAKSDTRTSVAIVGAGVLGRRLAVMWASTGKPVTICDFSPVVLKAAVEYFAETAPTVVQAGCSPGSLRAASGVEDGVRDAWLVIEAIPERLDLKRKLFRDLDSLTPPTTILATNSSSFRSAELINDVRHPERVLNIHAFMPPEHIPCEIMSCGKTSDAVLDRMELETRAVGFVPFRVRGQSSGFIHNRVWAAIKREALLVVAEGVATPQDLDALFRLRLRSPQGPFEMMDAVGLDTVLDIEKHYAEERGNLPPAPQELLNSYIAKGWLGRKSGRGFYEYGL